MSDLRRLSRYLFKHRAVLATSLLAAVLSSAFLGGSISLVKPLVEDLARGSGAAALEQAAPERPKEPGALERLAPESLLRLRDQARGVWEPVREWMLAQGYVRIPLVIVLLYVLKGLLGFVAQYGLQRVGMLGAMELREELYARSLEQSDAFYRVHGTAEMQSRILGDISRLQRILGSDLGQIVQSVPMALILLGVSLYFSWRVTLLCGLIIPLFGYAAARFGQRVKKAARRSQERHARLTGLIEETLLARRVVQAFDGAAHELRRFVTALQQMLKQDLRVARASAAAPPVMELIAAVAGAALMIYAGYLIRAGASEARDVLVALLSLSVVFMHVRRLGSMNTVVQQALASARRVFEVMDEPVLVRDAPGAVELPTIEQHIVCERVSFTYGRGPVLRELDLTIRKGEVHALVGPSGAGKTTLAMLIPRFIDPTAGRVLMDGRDLREATLASLRAQVALVTQETHLFDDTVLANIAYARPDAGEEEIRRAARAAHAEEFIVQLPHGFRTRLGERGGQLSAGQRQRIAIARAFLKDAPILILDEATSALDAESEVLVQRAIEALLSGRTVLIIAHRLSTIARADRIHVLEAGRIVESGRHAELLQRGGLYARLHALQAERASSTP
ncbi:MAG: ATP-binding cassette domain-containing protein [Acidobacteria bacterium]|nr:ATP-binding cassette domain-containing protein [Acidobacteriota bacterium]